MAGEQERNAPEQARDEAPGVIVHVTDQGATSPDPIPCTTDPAPPSALGGHSSARSGTAAGVYPAPEEP